MGLRGRVVLGGCVIPGILWLDYALFFAGIGNFVRFRRVVDGRVVVTNFWLNRNVSAASFRGWIILMTPI